jgi:hypothetical protein
MSIGQDNEVVAGINGGSIWNPPFERITKVVTQEITIQRDSCPIRVVKLDPIGVVLKIDDIRKSPRVGGHDFVDADLASGRSND